MARRTFGWQRIDILAAVGNAVLLFGVAAFVLIEAAQRLFDPPEVQSTLMLTVAAAGLAANSISLLILHRGRTESMNVRGAYLEVLGDLLRDAVDVLLEATPKGVDLDHHILHVPGVVDVARPARVDDHVAAPHD